MIFLWGKIWQYPRVHKLFFLRAAIKRYVTTVDFILCCGYFDCMTQCRAFVVTSWTDYLDISYRGRIRNQKTINPVYRFEYYSGQTTEIKNDFSKIYFVQDFLILRTKESAKIGSLRPFSCGNSMIFFKCALTESSPWATSPVKNLN